MNWFKKLFKQKITPLPDTPYWQAYQQSFESGYTQKTPIRAVRFVVLDTETTGLDAKKDKILSIGAVAVKDQKIIVADRFEYYLKQVYTAQGESIKIHGILPKHNLNGLAPKEVLILLLAYLQDSVIVGHHIGFDFAVLNRAFQEHLGGQLHNQLLDTNYLAKRIKSPFYKMNVGQNQNFSLDALCEQYGVPIYDRHTASGDALITALLFLKLMGRLEKKGVSNWGSLIK
ncbi:MAG: PolC-type DNA polymerase III [Saprospiraceae bacterium]